MEQINIEFIQLIIKKKLTNKETSLLVESIINSHELSRFAAMIDVDFICDYTCNVESLKVFNEIKNGILAKNLLQEHVISRLEKQLQSKGIQVILLKSTGLNGSLYKSPTCRGNTDIDILVKKCDEEKLNFILAEEYSLTKKNEKEIFDGLYERTWIKDNSSKVILDVHTNLANPYFYNIDVDKIFNTSAMHPRYQSQNIRILSPEYNFIHSLIHIINDGYLFHNSLIDAIQLYKNYSLDFSLINRISREIGCYDAVKFLNDEIKLILEEKDNNYKSNKIRNWIYRNILKNKYSKKSVKRRIQQNLVYLLILDSTVKNIKVIYKYLIKKYQLL